MGWTSYFSALNFALDLRLGVLLALNSTSPSFVANLTGRVVFVFSALYRNVTFFFGMIIFGDCNL